MRAERPSPALTDTIAPMFELVRLLLVIGVGLQGASVERASTVCVARIIDDASGQPIAGARFVVE